MLTCITCCKQKEEDPTEEAARGTPASKDSVKTLTTQIKEIALKASGSHKNPHDFAQSYSRYSRASADQVMPLEEDDEHDEEWTAQVEQGIHITFVSLPHGGNDLKRIRFSRDMYNKFEAQRWWGENYDRIMELYNVQRINRQALDTTARSDNGRDSCYSRLGSVRESPIMTESATREWSSNQCKPGSYYGDTTRTTTSSCDEGSVVPLSNACHMESEWVEEDEPGVYITIRQLADGTRELRRVRFRREQFGEMHAKTWWDAHKERIQAQYL